jgi:hypothetical protein
MQQHSLVRQKSGYFGLIAVILIVTVAQIAANSGRFALNWEISVWAGLRGGAERTRTSNQTVIAETRVNQGFPH